MASLLRTLRSAATKVPSAGMATATKPPVRVAVTGALGSIGYALVFRIASGAMLGPDQPVILNLIEVPQVVDKLEGVEMELHDCAFPLLHSVRRTSSLAEGFGDADYALLVGSKPRGPGMERKDLLEQNGAIFTTQGRALNDNARRTCKILVVGNPANTNALIAMSHAPNIPAENFTAMMRLDHNRALTQVALKTNTAVTDVARVCVWGNHSSTQYPDLSHASVRGAPALQTINDDAWVQNTFIPVVQQRGAAVIKARGASSAASAANAAIDHIRDWALGSNGSWVSMAVPSDGSYGIPAGLIYSYPVVCANGHYSRVQGLSVDDFSRKRMDATRDELLQERDAIRHLL